MLDPVFLDINWNLRTRFLDDPASVYLTHGQWTCAKQQKEKIERKNRRTQTLFCFFVADRNNNQSYSTFIPFLGF